jgi:acetyltransferase-like isoleucine patch superfamily enzyme
MLNEVSELHIVGYGGLGKEIHFLIESKFPNIKFCFYDDFSKSAGVHPVSEILKLDGIIYCVIAIGDPVGRKKVFKLLENNENIVFPNVILTEFDSYEFSQNNKLGIGNIIMPNAIIGFNCNLGNFNLLGVNSGLGHDVKVGDFNFIGPNSFLAGNVTLANECKLSFGTFALQRISIVSNINTMPYTCIYKNLKKIGTYYGNPAKLI